MPRKAAKRKQPSRIISPPNDFTAKDFDEALKAAGIKEIKFTPLQLLGFILKAVLQDRITDGEVQLIANVYYQTVIDWWS